MHHAGIDFGSHGVNHLILDKNGVDIDFELKQSKIDIEDRLSAPITAFSYPNGNYDPMIADKVRSHGYDQGFSTEFGYNGPKANRFRLKRINVHQDAGSTIPLFLGRLLGFW
jgi:peptidoglycan/xylan/chitin deacetylase (PgdA/CDA1 family)